MLYNNKIELISNKTWLGEGSDWGGSVGGGGGGNILRKLLDPRKKAWKVGLGVTLTEKSLGKTPLAKDFMHIKSMIILYFYVSPSIPQDVTEGMTTICTAQGCFLSSISICWLV